MEDKVRTKETIQKIVHGSASAERNDTSPGVFSDLLSETKYVSDHHPHRATLSVCRPAQKRRSSHGQLLGRSKMQKLKRVGAGQVRKPSGRNSNFPLNSLPTVPLEKDGKGRIVVDGNDIFAGASGSKIGPASLHQIEQVDDGNDKLCTEKKTEKTAPQMRIERANHLLWLGDKAEAFEEIMNGKGYYKKNDSTRFEMSENTYSQKAWLIYPFDKDVGKAYDRIEKIHEEKHGKVVTEKKPINSDEPFDPFAEYVFKTGVEDDR
ncbi:Oidioi.mRNA.OKI2018_I69.XSR.g15869.t1.cds [Oikopleura dioica]|uniref:Oidioi.mRNA.OKI2018_I69.XSR.g15869.t1.cds n=1 Tax=Oikopleura dioica TaxID=34765 RepID=A0ABN7SG43_OIKDI|nr:Oidioi.mRNA.OKI2018_I69.XSR.g15869.t1.cds [Oikopleura dioica]